MGFLFLGLRLKRGRFNWDWNGSENGKIGEIAEMMELNCYLVSPGLTSGTCTSIEFLSTICVLALVACCTHGLVLYGYEV